MGIIAQETEYSVIETSRSYDVSEIRRLWPNRPCKSPKFIRSSVKPIYAEISFLTKNDVQVCYTSKENLL